MASSTTNNQQPAQQAVLNTYELVESIIRAMPPKDILLAANVSQFWYTIVTTSPAVNKRLRSNRIPFWEDAQNPIESTRPDCLITLFLKQALILIRRLGEVEIIAYLPHKDKASACASASAVWPRILVSTEKQRQSSITKACEDTVIGYGDDSPEDGLSEDDSPEDDSPEVAETRPCIVGWNLDVWDEQGSTVWIATVIPSDFPYLAKGYKPRWYR